MGGALLGRAFLGDVDAEGLRPAVQQFIGIR